MPTPFDRFSLSIDEALLNRLQTEAAQSSQLNFWGDLYAALIPQAQRRWLGQFWTDARIADWLVAWLLQFKPRQLVDVGCGAGHFLLTAQRANDVPRLLGIDVSPLLLNLTLVARKDCALQLSVGDYLQTDLPAHTEAVICNPPYTRHHHIAPAVKEKMLAMFERAFQQSVHIV